MVLRGREPMTCPDCDGHGVFIVEPQDWWAGSGVNAEDIPCATCEGTGRINEPEEEST